MNFASRILLVGSGMILTMSCGSSSDLAERQEAVAVAGAEVMPFDLDATTHIFTDTETGGVQEVVADDPNDAANVEMIAQHLAEEAGKFQAGDFSDPEAIHGASMPGLAVLKARYAEIDVELVTGDDGSTLIYTTDDPELVKAIHDWFEAQASDHGEHAEHDA